MAISLLGMATGAHAYNPSYGEGRGQVERAYTLGILPHHNPRKIMAVYKPMLDILEARMGAPGIRLVASRNYAVFEERLKAGQFDFIMVNSLELVQYAGGAGYSAFAKWADDSQFRGICLVRRDGPVRDLAAIRGNTVSYPSPTALAGTLMVEAHLLNNGIDPRKDVAARYVGSHESSILSVSLGRVAMGCTGPRPWDRFQKETPDKAAELRVLFQTETLPHIAFAAHANVPLGVVAAMREALIGLDATPEGRAALAAIPTANIIPADDGTFEPTRAFMAWFSRTIRQPDIP